MFKNISGQFTGAALALAVAGIASSAAFAAEKPAADKTDAVHCSGVNSCKGHNDCKTAENACAGAGSCKGHGYLVMPSKACADVGGKVVDAGWKGETAKADLMHCTGVNACKGHNDCKTAENACAGKGSCKGHGFVAMTKAACANMGGK